MSYVVLRETPPATMDLLQPQAHDHAILGPFVSAVAATEWAARAEAHGVLGTGWTVEPLRAWTDYQVPLTA